MDANVLYELLEKYKTGSCTAAELEMLNNWYASLGQELPDEAVKEGSDVAIMLTQQKLYELKQRLNAEADAFTKDVLSRGSDKGKDSDKEYIFSKDADKEKEIDKEYIFSKDADKEKEIDKEYIFSKDAGKEYIFSKNASKEKDTDKEDAFSKEAPVKRMPSWKRTIGWAAALLGIAVVTSIAVFQMQKDPRQQTLMQQLSRPVDHSRHVVLPDGSTVVLHADSRLEYPVSFGSIREVTLEGEAYFDIKKDTGKPFVIHSGSLLTTVLGTAFNIKAYKDSANITVSVTRGKVKVETADNRTLLAVLTPDQQVVYSTKTAISQQQPVKALMQVQWVRQDMIFEDESFENIAASISRRYQVNIRFTNEALKKCRIRASFDGMESLEDVLGVLCTVRNANYQIDNDYDIIIDGKGCEN